MFYTAIHIAIVFIAPKTQSVRKIQISSLPIQIVNYIFMEMGEVHVKQVTNHSSEGKMYRLRLYPMYYHEKLYNCSQN